MNNNGWICPKCGRVYAPYVFECHYCNKEIKIPSYINKGGGEN